MEENSVLENLYNELKEKFEPKEENEEIDLDLEVIKEKAFKELVDEYEKQYRETKRMLLEVKIKDVKELQRKKLADYCKGCKYLDNPEIDVKALATEEKQLEESLKDIKKILDMLKGKSSIGEATTRDIKNFGDLRAC